MAAARGSGHEEGDLDMKRANEEQPAFEAAASLFFDHPELTAADWRRRLAAGSLTAGDGTDEPLSPAVLEELSGLVRQLEEVQTLQESENASGGLAPEEAGSAGLLEVRGREGCSYDLLGRIGTGGQSIVYRGLQKEPFERPVAIKVHYAAADETATLENLRELQAINRLHHPGICQVHDAGVTPWGQPFLALELIEGPPLQRYLDEAKPSCEARLRLFDELLGIVAYAHSEGVIHRDLKPHNILVHSGSGRLKLIDFSIAGIVRPDDTSRTAAGYGTRDYQSPEQAGLTSYRIDARTDVYSLGCLLFELLTGERAFPRPSADDDAPPMADAADREAQRAALGERMRELLCEQTPCCSLEQQAAFAAVVERCVATNPADRFQTVAELKAQVESLLAGQLPLIEVARKRRRGWGWKAAVAAALVAVAAGVAALIQPVPSSASSRVVPAPAEPTAVVSDASRDTAERIYEAVIGPVDGELPGFASAAEENAEHDNWLSLFREQLAALPPAERLPVGLSLAERLFDEDLSKIAAAVSSDFMEAFQFGGGDLRLQARMMTCRLCQVKRTDLEDVRLEAVALINALRENDLLETTPEGLTLVARCAGLMLKSFGPEGADSAKTWLTPLLSDPERLFAVDPTAASKVLLAGMKLHLAAHEPQEALALAAFVTRHNEARLSLRVRYAFFFQEFTALARLDRRDEAFERLRDFLTGTTEMSVPIAKRVISTMADIRMKQERYADAVVLLQSPAMREPPRRSRDAGVTCKANYDAGRCLLELARPEEAAASFHAAADLLPAWQVNIRRDLVHDVEAMVARTEATLAGVDEGR